MGGNISEILQKYYNEAVGGLVDKAPSLLNRGEATEIEYYIYKIDLVDSTLFVKNRTRQTYLKLAHTFLSAVNQITQIFGADGDQAEYAGDSVIAYFRASKVPAINVLAAAYHCRLAAIEMRTLDKIFRCFPFRTTAVIHYGKLIMAKIGPRGDWKVSAIGPELHKACKMEDKVGKGAGKVSKEFRGQLQGKEKFCLTGNYKETKVMIPPPPAPPITNSLGLLELLLPPPANSLLGRGGLVSLSDLTRPPAAQTQAPQYETKKELIDYSVQWDRLEKHLNERGLIIP